MTFFGASKAKEPFTPIINLGKVRILFNITLCSAERRKSYTWNGFRVSEIWDNFHFWMIIKPFNGSQILKINIEKY